MAKGAKKRSADRSKAKLQRRREHVQAALGVAAKPLKHAGAPSAPAATDKARRLAGSSAVLGITAAVLHARPTLKLPAHARARCALEAAEREPCPLPHLPAARACRAVSSARLMPPSCRSACLTRRRAQVTKYGKEESILVVGDGDLSFGRGLAQHRSTGAALLVTSYDSRRAVLRKYGKKARGPWHTSHASASGADPPRSAQAQACIDACVAAGCEVQHEVDATALDVAFPERRFQTVVFNFPHSGQQRAHVNQALLRGFFRAARCWGVEGWCGKG